MSETIPEASGGCYCGAVRFRARNIGREVTECHCAQCRKQAGHRYATIRAQTSEIEVEGAERITWYRASPMAERGFCSACGSHLFWRHSQEDFSAVLAASLDQPSGLTLVKHIFVADKGDYYEITDGLPQHAGYDRPPAPD